MSLPTTFFTGRGSSGKSYGWNYYDNLTNYYMAGHNVNGNIYWHKLDVLEANPSAGSGYEHTTNYNGTNSGWATMSLRNQLYYTYSANQLISPSTGVVWNTNTGINYRSYIDKDEDYVWGLDGSNVIRLSMANGNGTTYSNILQGATADSNNRDWFLDQYNNIWYNYNNNLRKSTYFSTETGATDKQTTASLSSATCTIIPWFNPNIVIVTNGSIVKTYDPSGSSILEIDSVTLNTNIPNGEIFTSSFDSGGGIIYIVEKGTTFAWATLEVSSSGALTKIANGTNTAAAAVYSLHSDGFGNIITHGNSYAEAWKPNSNYTSFTQHWQINTNLNISQDAGSTVFEENNKLYAQFI